MIRRINNNVVLDTPTIYLTSDGSTESLEIASSTNGAGLEYRGAPFLYVRGGGIVKEQLLDIWGILYLTLWILH